MDWNQVLRIRDILVRIRIRGSVQLSSGSCSFSRWLSRSQPKISFLFLSFFAFYFLKLHLHPSSKIKIHKKKSQNSRNQGFSCYFCLMIESGSVLSQINPDPDSGDPETYGSTKLPEPDTFPTWFLTSFQNAYSVQYTIQVYSIFTTVPFTSEIFLFLTFKRWHFDFFLVQKTSRSIEKITMAACSGFSKIKKGPEMNLQT
jgi:hypothetical protein